MQGKDRTTGHGSYPLQGPEEKDKKNLTRA